MKATVLIYIKRESRRVVNKNFRLLKGRPLYHWILECCANLSFVDKIIINTDCPELIQVPATVKNCHVEKRDKDLEGHHITATPLLRRSLERHEGTYFLMVHATHPFLKPATVEDAVKAFVKDGRHDALVSVTECFGRFFTNAGTPINHDVNNLLPTQELDPVLEENSAFFLFSREAFLRSGSRTGTNPLYWRMNAIEALDIDSEEDWTMAEALASHSCS